MFFLTDIPHRFEYIHKYVKNKTDISVYKFVHAKNCYCFTVETLLVEIEASTNATTA